MAKVTLQTIADKTGVSKVAVYKAINNQKGVSEELRRKIKSYAKSIGYVSKSDIDEVKSKRFMFFIKQDFFLVPSEQFFLPIFYFLSEECNKSNSIIQISFLESEQTFEKLKNAINAFDPDGIFFACETGPEILKYIEKISVPTVFIDYFTPLCSCNFVYVDNYHVAYQLTHYLINKGHKKIGFVGDIHSTSSIIDRYFGYLKALTEERLPIMSQWHINQNIERSETIPSLNLDDLPTAFICHCDAAAQRLYSTLASYGLKVPDDVSVVSFDNTHLSQSLIPPLTSVGPNKDYYAKKAYNTMMDAFKNKHNNVQIKTVLVERSSVKSLL